MVCVGNICRSPMAEYRLRSELADSEYTIESAGLGALVGRPIDPSAGEIMSSAGIDVSSHRARQLTPELLRSFDIALVMESGHEKALLEMAPLARGRVFQLGKWENDRPIVDPYRRSKEFFEHTYKIIEQDVVRWADFLARQ